MFKDYNIGKKVKDFKKITYVRFDICSDCSFRWTPLASTAEEERDAYEYWIKNEGYTELKMFNGDKEYVGTI